MPACPASRYNASASTTNALILTMTDTSAMRHLLASGGGGSGTCAAVFIGPWATAIAIGAALTGLIVSVLEED
jgi:hypothetical protein